MAVNGSPNGAVQGERVRGITAAAAKEAGQVCHWVGRCAELVLMPTLVRRFRLDSALQRHAAVHALGEDECCAKSRHEDVLCCAKHRMLRWQSDGRQGTSVALQTLTCTAGCAAPPVFAAHAGPLLSR